MPKSGQMQVRLNGDNLFVFRFDPLDDADARSCKVLLISCISAWKNPLWMAWVCWPGHCNACVVLVAGSPPYLACERRKVACKGSKMALMNGEVACMRYATIGGRRSEEEAGEEKRGIGSVRCRYTR